MIKQSELLRRWRCNVQCNNSGRYCYLPLGPRGVHYPLNTADIKAWVTALLSEQKGVTIECPPRKLRKHLHRLNEANSRRDKKLTKRTNKEKDSPTTLAQPSVTNVSVTNQYPFLQQGSDDYAAFQRYQQWHTSTQGYAISSPFV